MISSAAASMQSHHPPMRDYAKNPVLVYWEMTQVVLVRFFCVVYLETPCILLNLFCLQYKHSRIIKILDSFFSS